MSWWLRVVVGAVVTALVAVGLLWIFQRRLVYQPDTSSVPRAPTVLPGGRDVTLRTVDGLELTAWYVAAPPSPCRGTVLVAGGNAGNRLGRAPLAQALSSAGLGVLLIDYRGYGGNPGAPSEQGLAADIRSAHRFLTVEEGLAEHELVYLGESLGAGVVSELAVEHPPAGLVLRSPFVDLATAAAEHFPLLPVRLLLWDRFPVRQHVGEIRVPIAVIYGTADTVVPPEQSRAVADGAAGPVQAIAVPGADHNDRVLLDGPAVISAVVTVAQQGCPPSG